jgi:hypothetical protein
VAAFWGQLRLTAWRLPAAAALVASVLLVGRNYWPA